jgi:hypothetical protein
MIADFICFLALDWSAMRWHIDGLPHVVQSQERDCDWHRSCLNHVLAVRLAESLLPKSSNRL